MGSQETPGKATAENAWFILHFETTVGAVRQQRNVLVNSYPSLPLKEAEGNSAGKFTKLLTDWVTCSQATATLSWPCTS